MSKYKYEIAISFLEEDNQIADDIYNKFNSRYPVFVYSKHQEELAGKDGQVVFSNVFEKDSRLVIILFRNNWGKTKWTRIEETAIKNRAYENGYDNVLLVILNRNDTIPIYFPKTKIWHNFAEYGFNGLSAVINSKLTELKADILPITLEEKVQRKQIEMIFQKNRHEFLNSTESIHEGRRHYNNILQSANAMADRLNKENCKFITVEKDRSNISITGPKAQVTFYFQGYSNTTNCTHLILHLLKMVEFQFSKQYKDDLSETFKLDIDMANNLIWIDSDNKSYTNDNLVEKAIELILSIDR